MEPITELKVGTQLKADVLEAWCRPEIGVNLSHEPGTKWQSSNNVYGASQPLPITEIPSGADYFRIKNQGSGSLLFRRYGFVEFYNKFYNLVPQVIIDGNLDNFVITPIPERQREDIDTKIRALGFYEKIRSRPGHTYFRKNGNTMSWGGGDYWKSKQPNAIIITVEEFLGIKQQPMKNFDNCKVWVEANQFEAVMAVLRPIYHPDGFSVNPNGNNSVGLYIYSKDVVCKMGWDKKTAWENRPMRVLTVAEILGININNHILNTKAHEQIIVPRPVATITVGQRPTGTAVSGRADKSAITVGHLSNKAISSSF